MTVKDLKNLIKDAPDHYLVGVTNGDNTILWPDLPGDCSGYQVILVPRPKDA